MYKGMIIDDESIVRWGLRDLMDWESEGFELCEDGTDGRDGLEKLLAHVPELVLVDIKMPGISGIELIRSAREAGFSGHFIILTGYSEFEFAKSAISLGVEEYLLKPVDEEELLRCVRKVREGLDRQREESILRIAREDAAREELVGDILLRRQSVQELEKRMGQYGVWLDGNILGVAILTDQGAEGQQGKDMSGSTGGFQKKGKEFLSDTSLYAYKTAIDGRIVLVGQGLDSGEWAEKLSRRNDKLRARYGEGLLIAVGSCVGRWYDLCEAYASAKYMLEQVFLLGQYDVLSMSVVEEQRKGENPPAEYFLMLAEVGDLEGIREGVEKFKAYCIRNLLKETDVKTLVLYNLMTIRTEVEKKYGTWEGDITEQIEELNRAGQLEHLMEQYGEILQKLCRRIGRDGSDTVVKRIYYYMEKNYGQEMKLETFARMFHYNANYLGKAFRKEIGDSFNNVLDAIRIANAKRLLQETDLKVYQISEQVGYKNIDYFYLKFKKYAGVSPREYKRETGEGAALD